MAVVDAPEPVVGNGVEHNEVPDKEDVVEAPLANGNEHAEEAPASTKEKAEPAVAAAEEPEEELWRRRLWFVRVPKPPEVPVIKALEQELETYRTQHRLLSESANLKKLDRDAAREKTRAAQDAYKQCRQAYDERDEPLRKLRETDKAARGQADQLKSKFSDLEVRSEQELDATLRQLHYTIEHESIPLNEEKKILARIKKLEAQRERVKEYEASASVFADSKEKRKELVELMREHEAELRVLREERDTQRAIVDKLREQEKALDEGVEEILTERRRVKELLDDCYNRVNELKKVQRAKNDEYYNNRRFSRQIREVLAEGKLEEARQMCAEQMEEAHAKLSSNTAYRTEYFALWEQQRKVPINKAALSDEEDAAPAVAAGGKRGKGAAKQQQKPKEAAAPPMEPAKKAEAIIAAALQQAQEEMTRAKAAAAAAPAVAVPTAVEAPAEEAASARPAEVVGMVEGEGAEGSAAAAAVRKPQHRPRPHAVPVEPAVEPEDNFELPAVVAQKKQGPSAAELKELERQRQREAQAEAERRKAKRQQEKERKRQKAAELAAKEAAAAAASAAASADEADTSGAEGEAAAASAAEESAGEAPAAVAAAPAVPAALQPTASGKSKQGKMKGAAAAAAKARSSTVAKRPAAVHKNQWQKWYKYATDNMTLILVALIAVFFVMIGILGFLNS